MQKYDLLIAEQLKTRGYKSLNKNSSIYGRMENGVMYVVVLGNGYNISTDNVTKFNNQIKLNFFKGGASDVRILNLIITKTSADGGFEENVLDICRRVENVWIFAEDYARLFIFENQPEDFDDLRNPIEANVKPQKSSFGSFVKDNIEPVTAALIIINIAVYIVSVINPNVITVLANNYIYAVIKKQYYRIFTSMFLHFSLSHIVNNMLVLLIMGPRAERVMGKTAFLTAYIFTGIVASVCSLHFSDYYTFSAGASGAICGIFGMLIVYAIFNKGNVSGLSLRYLIFISVITILNGFTTSGIDNYAHIGGFISGIIVGCISIPIHNMVVKNKSM